MENERLQSIVRRKNGELELKTEAILKEKLVAQALRLDMENQVSVKLLVMKTTNEKLETESSDLRLKNLQLHRKHEELASEHQTLMMTKQ